MATAPWIRQMILVVPLVAAGCATPVRTIPPNHAFGPGEESVVVGRVTFDVRVKPLAFFAGLMKTLLTVKHEKTGKEYIIVCDQRGLDSDFYVSLPPGGYRLVKVEMGNLQLPVDGRFEVGRRQVHYVGTLKFRGLTLLGPGEWQVEDEVDKTMGAFRRSHPEVAQPPITALMQAGRTTERVAMGFDGRDWRVGFSSDRGGQVIFEFVLPGETVKAWTEMVTFQSFPGAQARLEETMLGMRESILRDCPTALWNVIRREPTAITYEWQAADCPKVANQWEVSKLMRGETALHRAAYATKRLPVGDDVRAEWRERIDKASVSTAR